MLSVKTARLAALFCAVPALAACAIAGLAEFIRADRARWSKLVQEAGIERE